MREHKRFLPFVDLQDGNLSTAMTYRLPRQVADEFEAIERHQGRELLSIPKSVRSARHCHKARAADLRWR
jgi:hypothetical protein